MKKAANNPASNVLGHGITEENLTAAVDKSGYPLQTIIADQLREQFRVQEEWSYIDRDTQDLRTIDLLAIRELYDIKQSQKRIRPHLSLLIECKQSPLPYVFFLSRSKPWLPEFPLLAGLAQNSIIITTGDDPSTWTFSVMHAFELDRHDFVSRPAYSTTFSKCVRKGNHFELSGSDSYNNLVLPLLKALQHYRVAEMPVGTAVYFDAYLSLAIGVLDAPMIGVSVTHSANDLVLMPWVRALRHESVEASHPFERSKMFVVDLVHKDFLAAFLSDHALPFAQRFAELSIKHHEELATGQGFVPAMAKSRRKGLEARLRPRSMKTKMARASATGKNIARLLRGEKQRIA